MDGTTFTYKDGCKKFEKQPDGSTNYINTWALYDGSTYQANVSKDNDSSNDAQEKLEFAEALQGGKLLTPIFDLLVTIGDGLMSVMQRAITGTKADMAIDFSTSLLGKIGVVLGILAAVATIIVITAITGGIGAWAAGLAGKIGPILVAVGKTGIVSTIVSITTLGAAMGVYRWATSAYAAAVLPDITVFPTYSIGPEEIFEGKLLIFDINFFKPKQVKVHLKASGDDIKVQDYDESTNGEAEYYYYEEDGKKIETSKQDTAMDLSQTISKWYYAIRNIAIVIMMLVLVYIGIRMMLCSIASEKSKYKKMLGDWVISMCLVFVLQYIMVFAVNLNESIVKLIESSTDKGKYAIALSDVKDKDNFVKTIEKNSDLKQGLVDSNGVNLYNEDGSKNSNNEATSFVWPTNLVGRMRMMAQMQDGTDEYIGYCLAFLVLVFYTIFFAATYLKRVIYMAFLTVIAPLVAMTYSIDKIADGKAQAFNMWLKEYMFNLLIQPVHLLLYMLLISMSFDLAANNIIYTLVALGFMMPAEKLIRKMFGFEKASTPGFLGGAAGAAVAMSALKGLNKFSGRGPGPKGAEKAPKLAKNNSEDSSKFGISSPKGFTELFAGENPEGNNPTGADKSNGKDPIKQNGDDESNTVGLNGDNSSGQLDNPDNELPDYEDIRLAEESANAADFLEDEDRRKYDILNNPDNDFSGSEGAQNLKRDLEERANNNKKIHFDKERNKRRMLEESKKREEEKKKYQSNWSTFKRMGMNNMKHNLSKENMKNAVATTAKNGARLTGAVLAGGIGAAAGIAAGDPKATFQNAVLGATAGESIASGLVNGTSNMKENYGDAKTKYEKAKYGEDYKDYKDEKVNKKWAKDAGTREQFAQAFSKELQGLKGKEYEEKLNGFIETGKKYRTQGVQDNDLIIAGMKLDRDNKGSNDNIAAAMMASKAKDLKGIETYQKKLAKQIGEERAKSIANNAAKIGGYYE